MTTKQKFIQDIKHTPLIYIEELYELYLGMKPLVIDNHRLKQKAVNQPMDYPSLSNFFDAHQIPDVSEPPRPCS